MATNYLYSYKTKKPFFYFLKIFLGFFTFTLFVLFVGLWYLFLPMPFTDEKIVTIPDGYSITKTSQLLQDEGIIRSHHVLRVIMQSGKLSPKSGPYLFENAQSIQNIAIRLDKGDYGDVYEKLTIPEGSTNAQILKILKKTSLRIDDEQILNNLLAMNEGYFFPDTYSFLPGTSAIEILETIQNDFKIKFQEAIKDKSIEKTDKEIVIMASILEKEAANNLKEKQIISGILWKRIREGMLLQVDAPFLYERGKGSAQLSNTDLQTKSPYNTYINLGLTPTAIGNPGSVALYAAAHPVDSPYYFYLHAPNGKIYYGKNHTEHLKNIKKYLR